MSEILSNSRTRSAGRLIAISSAVGVSAWLSPAFAQEAIVPVDQAPVAAAQPAANGEVREKNENTGPNTVPAASATRGQIAPLPTQATITIEFEDAPISTILKTLSQAFNIPIIIQKDVNDKLEYLNLIDETPEEAIRKVTAAGHLKFVRDKTDVLFPLCHI